MKNNTLRRAVTLLTMLAMMLTLVSGVVAFADPADPALIDTNEKGSITVHKYATVKKADGTTGPQTHTGNNATGTTSDEAAINTANIYEPINNAKFKLYLIDSDIAGYYNGLESSSDVYTVSNRKPMKNGSVVSLTDIVPQEGKTEGQGELTFSNLDVGIYFLEEYNDDTSADQITWPLADPCLIAIPMVNTMYNGGTTGSNNNNNAQWMYTVNVYPKNHEATAAFELTKKQADGTTPIENVVFELKKNEYTNESRTELSGWSDVKVASTDLQETPDKEYTNAVLTTDEYGKISADRLPAGLYGTVYKLTEVSAPAADGFIENHTPLYFTVLPNNTIVWNETAGEYNNINSSVGTTTTGTTDNGEPLLTILLKNERPDITKTVQENKTNPGYANWAQYSIGDTINYKLEVTIPANIAELKTFTVLDTCEYLTNWSDPVVKVITGPNTSTTVQDLVIQNVTSGGFKIEFGQTTDANDNNDKIVAASAAGKTLEITYSAVLNSNAVVKGTGNTNPATLTYSKSTNTDEATNYEIIDKAVVYTYQYSITKYKDSAAANNEAQGVEFELYESNGTTRVPMINVTENEDGEYRHTANTTEAGTEGKGVTLKTDADGKLVLQGLEPGTYKLKETKTLDGYNLLSDFVTIKVMMNGEVITTETGVETKDTSFSDGTMEKETDGKTSAWADESHKQNIINKKGFVLPQTGSMGYLLFCAAGLVLIGGGAALIFSGRKKVIR